METGVVKLKVVLAVGGATVADALPAVIVIELKIEGRLTLTVTDETLTGPAEGFVTMKLPPLTV